MNSQTNIVAEQTRLSQWANDIRDCRNRPAGMKIEEWCSIHGLSKSNYYYYRLRRVRKACLDAIRPEEQTAAFIELPASEQPLPDGVPGKTAAVLRGTNWRTRPLSGTYPYVYVDGVYLKRSWGGEIQNVSILVAIGVSNDGCREIIGAAEGMKEDKESWRSFFVWLKERGLTGVRLIIGDKNLGMLETIPEVFAICAS